MMNWINLNTEEAVDLAIQQSFDKPVLFFKHSTRCGISASAQHQLIDNWDLNEDMITTYHLDLLSFRNVSNYIAEKLDVLHQSPQAILVKNGKAVYSVTHHAISVKKIKNQLAELVH